MIPNLYLFIKTFIVTCRIAMLSLRGKEHVVVRELETLHPSAHHRYTKEEIINKINTSLFILRRCGFKYACYERSLIICYMSRWAGFDTKIHFGAKKEDKELNGHCWVDDNAGRWCEEDIIATYPV
ncbi:lasso peptide biosynthesis B2 protein [Candidatus Omnitrophota bacterium]